MITYPDAYTRTCQACGHAYDAGDFDDPNGAPAWMQDDCPACWAKQSGRSVYVAPPEQPRKVGHELTIPP